MDDWMFVNDIYFKISMSNIHLCYAWKSFIILGKTVFAIVTKVTTDQSMCSFQQCLLMSPQERVWCFEYCSIVFSYNNTDYCLNKLNKKHCAIVLLSFLITIKNIVLINKKTHYGIAMLYCLELQERYFW